MDGRWFKEDRKIKDPTERYEAIARTKKVILAGTTYTQRLKGILKDEYDKCITEEENYYQDNWDRVALANAAQRKAYKNIIKLLQK